jgi:hypothetical protein
LRAAGVRHFGTFIVSIALVAGLAGCASLGPRTLNRDQLDYGSSIGHNWKNQMLANLVRLRFVDMPVFVDVGQIVSGYSLETIVNGTVGWGTTFTGGDSQSVGAAGRYTDRPTITYMPKTGEDYLRSLLEPVPPRSLLSLLAAGYKPELLFTWAVESINGVHNFTEVRGKLQLPDPRYYEYVEILTELQESAAVGFELKEDPESGQDIVLIFSDIDISPETIAKRDRAREILGLDPDVNEFRVIYSPFSTGRDVLGMQTRSIMQIMAAMARFIEIPADKSRRATPGYRVPPEMMRPFRVYSGSEQPEDAFASFQYDDDWYWIEQEDLASKRVFTLMLFLTTLTNRAGTENAPVLTIPTN